MEFLGTRVIVQVREDSRESWLMKVFEYLVQLMNIHIMRIVQNFLKFH